MTDAPAPDTKSAQPAPKPMSRSAKGCLGFAIFVVLLVAIPLLAGKSKPDEAGSSEAATAQPTRVVQPGRLGVGVDAFNAIPLVAKKAYKVTGSDGTQQPARMYAFEQYVDKFTATLVLRGDPADLTEVSGSAYISKAKRAADMTGQENAEFLMSGMLAAQVISIATTAPAENILAWLIKTGSDGTGTLKFKYAEITASTLNSAEAVIVNYTVRPRGQ